MKKTIGLLLACGLLAPSLCGGELFGTITDGRKPLPAGTKVEITAPGKTYTAETDKFGSYRIIVKEKGKCTITVRVQNQTASADLFSYDKSTRYNWTLESKDGKLVLRRQ